MKNTYPYLLAVVLATACFNALAGNFVDTTTHYPEMETLRRSIENTHPVIIDKGDTSIASKDSIRSLITMFYMNQYRHSQDPKAPYFMFISKDANLAMGVGGVIRMRGWFDWNGSIPSPGFAPYAIPIPKDPSAKERLSATPAGTAVFLTILGKNKSIGDFMGYIEAKFNGYKNLDFKLSKAYIIFNDWTMGYASSTFIDHASVALTIDGAGPNGSLSKTAVLLRYFHTFKNNWSVGAGVEFPSSTISDNSADSKGCPDYVPDLVVLAQYQWGGGMSHVRLSGLLRFMRYRNLLEEKNHTVKGWAVQLSGMFRPIYPLTLYYGATYGRGFGSYTGDLSYGSYDLVPDSEIPGMMYAPKALAVTTGLKYNFKYNIYSCIALGHLRYYADHPEVREYKYGLYGAANLFWEITPRFSVGIEYLVGKRMNYGGSHAPANRIDAMFMLSF